MKKNTALLSNLFLSSTLLWGASIVKADDAGVKTPLDVPAYCHMQFPEMRTDTLGWDRPMLDESSGRTVDFYGSCEHDPTGGDEIQTQRRMILRGFHDDGE
jgi:hypothetical protein